LATAFVLINTDPGEGTGVLKALEEIPEVKEVHKVYGVHNLIIRLEADTWRNSRT